MNTKIITLILILLTSLPAWADFLTGIEAFQSKNYGKAYDEWLPLAEEGLAGAQSNLGLMYDLGLGVNQNYLTAITWYQKAANQGDISAQYNLGVIYFQGKGIEKNYTKATEWFLESAQNGHPHAQNNLGWIYEQGLGTKKSLIKAKKWYQLAANQQHSLAQKNLEKINQKLAKPSQLPPFNSYIKWVEEQPLENYTLQIASAKSIKGLEELITKNQLTHAQIVPQLRNEQINYVILLGSTSSKSEIRDLASEIKSTLGITGWIRKIAGVRKYLGNL